jgi:hypothetical protein
MKLLALIMYVFLFSSTVQARVKELSLELRTMNKAHTRQGLYPFERDVSKYVGLNLDLDFVNGLLYWDNRTYFYGTSSRVKHVGWQWEVGANINSSLQLFYYHHSEHTQDRPAPTMDEFPLEDSIGIRINLLN